MVELLVTSAGREAPALIVRKYIDEPARLAHQVRWLTRAQGSGIVRLHAVDSDAGHYSTCFGGPLTVAAAATDPDAAVTMLGAVWGVLERLHRLGLTHGAVTADHAVIAGHGPLLLSPGGPEPVDRSDDITGFGQMIVGVAGVWSATATGGDPLVERWATTGRRIIALGEQAASSDERHLVTGAEVRRLLAELQPADRSVRWSAGAWFRKRPGESGRGRRADRRPIRS